MSAIIALVLTTLCSLWCNKPIWDCSTPSLVSTCN